MNDLRALDALIDHHVWGYEIGERTSPGWQTHYYRKTAGEESVPHYHADIALAIGVLEKLREDDWTWAIGALRPSGLVLRSSKHTKTSTKTYWDMNIAEAICRHVLHVLGLEVKP